MTVYLIPTKKNDYDSNVLIHHGILGQKWGVRRFQNEDGSLTEAGKKRYYQSLDDDYFPSEDEDDNYDQRHTYDLSNKDDRLRYVVNADYSFKDRKQYHEIEKNLYDSLPIDVDIFNITGRNVKSDKQFLGTASGKNTKNVSDRLIKQLENESDKKKRRELVDDFLGSRLPEAVLKDLGCTVNDDNKKYITKYMYSIYY